jgi:hypothetical protein
MKRENLQKMADHIRTIPQELFDMRHYRSNKDSCNPAADEQEYECNSVGCVIGHCLTLAPNLVTRCPEGVIQFADWSVEFTNTYWFGDEWSWCFSHVWEQFDNTPEGAALRIEWLLKNGLPEDWKRQMHGEATLCYLPQTKNPTPK